MGGEKFLKAVVQVLAFGCIILALVLTVPMIQKLLPKKENPKLVDISKLIKPMPIRITAEAGNKTSQEAPPAPCAESQITVEDGDRLWDIAKRAYGNPRLYTKIVAANQIDNPDLIYAGQVLSIPCLTAVEKESVEKMLQIAARHQAKPAIHKQHSSEIELVSASQPEMVGAPSTEWKISVYGMQVAENFVEKSDPAEKPISPTVIDLGKFQASETPQIQWVRR